MFEDINRIKILHIVPSISKTNGIMSVLIEYYKKIDRNVFSFDFIFFNRRKYEYVEEIKELGGNIFYMPRPSSVYKFISFINRFSKENYGKYKIIHLHIPFLMLFFYPLKRKLNAKSFIIHAHSTCYGDTKKTSVRNRIMYKLSPYKPDCYFACSNVAGLSLFGNNYKSNGYYMQNIIDCSKYYPNLKIRKELRKEMNIEEDNIVIGHVGNFTHYKNHKFILEVFSKIYSINRKYRLLLVGDGKLKNEIEKLSKTFKIDDATIFCGAKTNTENYYRVMDLFLFPSLWEGLGMAALEAQACGLKCIFSNNIPEEANVNPDSNGVISLDEDIDVWIEKIFYQVDNKKASCINLNEIFNKSVKNLENKYKALLNDR